MAAPFGGHPTFGQYLRWAKEAGCEINSGYGLIESGEARTVTRIVAPGGQRWVTVVGVEQTDYLVPTEIARYDRRLGMTSPFFSIDDAAC